MSAISGRLPFVMMLATLTISGCGGDAAEEAAPEPNPPSVVRNPVGVVTRVSASAGIAEMRVALNSLEAAEAAEMKAMLPKHRATTEALLTAMETEMKSTGKALSAEWTATAETVRQEVAGLGQMSAGQLSVVVPVHASNLRRLMELHEANRP